MAAISKEKLEKILEELCSHPEKSFNVHWNKDYTIEKSWLAGKPVGPSGTLDKQLN